MISSNLINLVYLYLLSPLHTETVSQDSDHD